MLSSANGIYPVRTLISNLCLVSTDTAGDSQSSSFVIVDAGMPLSGGRIFDAIAEHYGKEAAPSAIILTHGHFDHVGALSTLLTRYNVPVYAHGLEIPYLTGEVDYPPAHPDMGGGLMSFMSPLYPRKAIDIGNKVRTLPDDGAVPGLPGWKWLHTPGHTPGHISLFRESDRALIAGDAFTTVKQESLLAVLTQREEVHGPPAYFTMNWMKARESVRKLTALRPDWVITGHGRAMAGQALQEGLALLAKDFEAFTIRGTRTAH